MKPGNSCADIPLLSKKRRGDDSSVDTRDFDEVEETLEAETTGSLPVILPVASSEGVDLGPKKSVLPLQSGDTRNLGQMYNLKKLATSAQGGGLGLEDQESLITSIDTKLDDSSSTPPTQPSTCGGGEDGVHKHDGNYKVDTSSGDSQVLAHDDGTQSLSEEAITTRRSSVPPPKSAKTHRPSQSHLQQVLLKAPFVPKFEHSEDEITILDKLGEGCDAIVFRITVGDKSFALKVVSSLYSFFSAYSCLTLFIA